MRIQVECRAERASEGPRRFVLGEQTIEVDDLLDRWYGGDADYFPARGVDPPPVAQEDERAVVRLERGANVGWQRARGPTRRATRAQAARRCSRCSAAGRVSLAGAPGR